ncbi:MAG: hypothetical protein NC548_06525 [Lachnospiraceae bacterium]|nr:hypothetical protein [Lachnospiraceae bacterium]
MKLLEHIFGIRKAGEFEPGSIVKITTNEHIYGSYSQMMKHHPQYALRWAYKVFKADLTHKYIILKIYPHVMKNRYDDNKYCFIIEDTVTRQIFMIGELGLEKLR